MSDILKLTPFDASKRALEGTTNFRENANYSWAWLVQHTIEVNALINDLNIYKNGLKEIFTQYVQEELEGALINKDTLGLDKVDNTADKDKKVLTATKLYPGRLIGGIAFDGSVNISLPGVNTTGNQNTTGNAGSATKFATARNIGGVSFDGSADIDLPGVNKTGNQNTTGNAKSATTAETCSGNAATATKLATPRNIIIGKNSKVFDGTTNVVFSLEEIGAVVVAGNTKNGYVEFSNRFIIQWLTVKNGSATVNFPKTFPTACLSVQGTVNANAYYGIGIISFSTNGFTYNSASGDCLILAIGY